MRLSPRVALIGIVVVLLMLWMGRDRVPGLRKSPPPTLPIPVGKLASDVYLNQETLAISRNISLNNPGGVSAGFWPIYGQRTEDRLVFYVAEGEALQGDLRINNGDDQAHEMVIICLIDFVAVPCEPGQQSPIIRELAAQEHLFLPVEIPNLASGTHDFATLIVRDPYVDIELEHFGRSHRLSPLVIMPFYSLYVGDEVAGPSVTPVEPPLTRPANEAFGGGKFMANLEEDMIGPDGQGAGGWLRPQASPGEMIPFFLHFPETYDPNPWHKQIAMMAFINYQQVPLHVDGEAHLPLYVTRAGRTLQTLPAAIEAPAEPGRYEMLIVYQDYAHQRFNTWPVLFHYADHESTPLMRLDVIAP